MLPQLRLTNTLTRSKDIFAPIDPANVRMYVCGPTVYDDAHIGNARPIIFFDLLFRLLRHLYGAEHVTYARNLTDVDDKINARAAERGISIRELTDGTIGRFHRDIRALGVVMPEESGGRLIEPRATDHIGEMAAMIERLIAAGHAYVAQDHVLFSVPAMADYGSLSRRPLDEMEAGARVDVAPYKRSPLDFVLWKPSKAGDPAWPSPAGIAVPGRPGWHIECSAMSRKHLGERFDIHGGGIDLIFPHHENELAQSRCCFDTPVMANVWLHNGFLQVEGQKMSKSLGNFITIREVLRDWPGEVARLAMLKTHYRQPIDWTLRGLDESKRELNEWAAQIAGSGAAGYLEGEKHDDARLPFDDVVEALADDLNTPAALTALREQAKAAKGNRHRCAKLLSTLSFLGLIRADRLGVFEAGLAAMGVAGDVQGGVADANRLRAAYANDDQERVQALSAGLGEQFAATIELKASGALVLRGAQDNLEERIEALIADRAAARGAKNWAESDRLRGELAALGVTLKDNKDGTTTWDIAR